MCINEWFAPLRDVKITSIATSNAFYFKEYILERFKTKKN